MNEEKIGKTKSGRVWHILDDNETLCGKMANSGWMFHWVMSLKNNKMCKSCMDMYEESIMDEPAQPIKRKNPHRTW